MDVSLREVTAETVRSIVALKVAPDQERFVASNGLSISQAYFDRDVAWFRGVYADDEPVGFVMVELQSGEEPFLWRFMVDARHQGKGVGRRAMELVIEHVRALPGCTEFFTSHGEGDGCPGPFYEKLGFEHTGKKEDDELEMVLKLN